MTHLLDQARDTADDIARWLDAADPTEPLDEDRLDELTDMLVGCVKHHNDELAEAKLQEGADGA